jgi:transcriptional regulator with XRE-family HTH domain
MQLLEIGKAVARRRAELQLSQAQLAKLAGLSRLTINHLEAGKMKDLGASKLINLLAVLGLNLDIVPQANRSGLFKAAVSANVSYRNTLTPEDLENALASGTIPPGCESHLSVILDEVPVPIVVKAVEEAAAHTGMRPKQMWKHLATWSRELHLYRQVWQ